MCRYCVEFAACVSVFCSLCLRSFLCDIHFLAGWTEGFVCVCVLLWIGALTDLDAEFLVFGLLPLMDILVHIFHQAEKSLVL